jgi:phage tail-like protein
MVNLSTNSSADLQLLDLQLTPMKIAETALEPITNSSQIGQSFSMTAALSNLENKTSKDLVIYPGEASEMLIQLENRSQQKYIYFEIQIETNFPNHWYVFRIENNQIAPQKKIEAGLCCQIPEDFFESQKSLQSDRYINLDYFGRIHICYTFQDHPGLTAENLTNLPAELYVKSADFHLYLRPRSLYLNFLPDLYREVDFIGRLLNIFEQTFEPVVDALDVLHAYLDPRTAPEAMLPFLAYWVGWRFIPNITLERQRYLIHQAMEIYRWRGTKKGLRFFLHLYTGLPLDEEYIDIQDIFEQGFKIDDKTKLGINSIIGGSKPYHFIVRLRHPETDQIDEQLVRQIIEQEKPAFCTYELNIDIINLEPTNLNT